ncbi:MAG: CheR family methyltransferase [bacterium]
MSLRNHPVMHSLQSRWQMDLRDRSGTAPDSLTDLQFEFLSTLAEAESGIVLSESKRPMLYARLVRRLNELNLRSFDAYIDLLKTGNSGELDDFTNRVTTNLTYFFREPGHFAFLKNQVLPKLQQQNRSAKPLRIWSAGCSTGQEPYSLAMTVESARPSPFRETRILCTDLNTRVLRQAAAGRYKSEDLRGLTDQQRERWFSKTAQNEYLCDPRLKNMLIFKRLNLLKPWPIKPEVDVIFCRNVLIYFSRQNHKLLLERFAKLLKVEGYLFLGHSESLSFATRYFERVSATVYKRVC